MNATPSRGRREFDRIGLGEVLAAGLVGAAVLTLIALKSDMVSSLFKKLFQGRSQALRLHGSFASLRRAILGSNKHTIAEVFGPPPASGVTGKLPAPGQPHYWYASTWYYPLDRRQQSAVAIEFDEGVATKVDVIRPPRSRSSRSSGAR